MDFMQSKALTAALVFGIVVVSFAVLLGQAGNFFSTAQGAPKITGSIVLLDDMKFFITYVPSGAGTSSSFLYSINAPVALPGAGSCSVKISGCCSNNAGSSDIDQMNISIGSVSTSTSESIPEPKCFTATGNLAGGAVYDSQLNCADDPAGQPKGHYPAYMAVAYSCDA